MRKDPAQSYHAYLTQSPEYEGQVVTYAFFPPRKAEFATEPPAAYAEQFARLGFGPYAHQGSALAALERGEDVVVATQTASGKSLAFQLPALAALVAGRSALLVYPTKALANDQLERLRLLHTTLTPGVAAERINAYDGDTPAGRRQRVREAAGLVLTNPDMLHYGILPHHARWAPLLSTLDYLVLDELHAYRGVFGSHAANIVRRLLRLARAYGSSPRVVAASATIGNPAEHLERLTGRRATLIANDAAPAAAREFMIWQPPKTSEGSERRLSPNTEAARLATLFARARIRSIFFCNSRRSAELVRRYAAGMAGEPLATTIQAYRAGYTPADRRTLESGIKEGDITVLISTSALELGVDIGGVDAVVLVGYPGSKMALWQRSGRAGRGDRRALTLLITGADPLDEYYRTHPDALLEGPVEEAVADPFNGELHPRHLVCAAAELPLIAPRAGAAGPAPEGGMIAPWVQLDEVAGLIRSGDVYASKLRYPHRRVQLRGGSGKLIRLKDGNGRSLGATDFVTALRELHPGAVYLHQGEQYLVAALDLERGVARLLPHIEEYYTQPRSETEIEILGPLPARSLQPGEVALPPAGVEVGRVRVRHQVFSYVRKRFYSDAVLEERPLDLPEVSYDTQAVWFGLRGTRPVPAGTDVASGLHALEHTLIGLLPSFVLCERADVGGVSYPLYPATGEPLVFVYDGAPGGVGYARAGAAVFGVWLRAARDLLAACPCAAGCPRCVLSPKCGNGNQHLDKGAALALAEALLDPRSVVTA